MHAFRHSPDDFVDIFREVALRLQIENPPPKPKSIVGSGFRAIRIEDA